MGREATCQCRWNTEEAPVNARLEATEILLRGTTRRCIPLSRITDLRVQADALSFTVGTDRVMLMLGEKQAASWAGKIAAPPPTLREKLGLAPSCLAFVVHPVTDAALLAALQGVTTPAPDRAGLILAMAQDPSALQNALDLQSKSPIWVIHGKGRSAVFGEGPVRTVMRAAGFVDIKVAAISANLTATRYVRRH